MLTCAALCTVLCRAEWLYCLLILHHLIRAQDTSLPCSHAPCCAGQSDVAHYLLEAGAVCNEYTFDGDRCHYAALTATIRWPSTPTLELGLA